MTLGAAAFVVLGFAALIHWMGLVERAREVTDRARRCVQVLGDPELGDLAKERELRSQSLRLFRLLAVLVGGSALALACPLGAVWALDRLGWASLPEVLTLLQRWDFLAATFALGFVAWALHRRSAES